MDNPTPKISPGSSFTAANLSASQALILTRENIASLTSLTDYVNDLALDKRVKAPSLRVLSNIGEFSEALMRLQRSWEKKKQGALLHMKDYSLESMFLKSADVIANASETLADHNKIGDEIFSQFGGGKTRFIEHMLSVISLLKQDWRENPLWDDLELIEGKFRAIASS